jgi:hypothetical protein
MSLSTVGTSLINRYGIATTINGSSVGKAYWKKADITKTQQFGKTDDWGKAAYEVWVLASATTPVVGQSIARTGQTMIIRAISYDDVGSTLAYWNVIAFPIEGE